jgi:hypothetical protein
VTDLGDIGGDDERRREEVRSLRERGYSPKAIARALGCRPAEVQQIIRDLAEAAPQRAEAALLACYVNQGWAYGLGVDAHPEWPRGVGGDGSAGLATVVVARAGRGSRSRVCSILVDTFCLGVKLVIGPKDMTAERFSGFCRDVYSSYGHPPIEVPVELAQHLVFGAVEFARELGFEPVSDFGPCGDLLGLPVGPCPIRFGYNGRATYVSGPRDDPARILATLERSVGLGDSDFVMGGPPPGP